MLHDDHLHLRTHKIPPLPHELSPMLREAEKRGVVPGFREHPPLPHAFRIGPFGDFDYAMREDELERFVFLFAGEKHPLGFEFDYIAGEEDGLKSILDSVTSAAAARGVELSGVIGSVHLLPGSIKDVDYPKGKVKHVLWDLDENIFIRHLKDRGPERLLHDYFGAMLELVALGIYDCLGHIDVIRKFDRKNQSGESLYYGDVEKLYTELSRRVIERISETSMAVEINTAGLISPIGRPYISQELLNYAIELGVPVSLGSDAHSPERVGAGFDVALKMLEAAGRDYLVTFRNRKAVRYNL